jgi:hypothetical protein
MASARYPHPTHPGEAPQTAFSHDSMGPILATFVHNRREDFMYGHRACPCCTSRGSCGGRWRSSSTSGASRLRRLRTGEGPSSTAGGSRRPTSLLGDSPLLLPFAPRWAYTYRTFAEGGFPAEEGGLRRWAVIGSGHEVHLEGHSPPSGRRTALAPERRVQFPRRRGDEPECLFPRNSGLLPRPASDLRLRRPMAHRPALVDL